jgi:hypothetical protein
MSLLTVARVRDLGPQFVDNPHRMVGQDGAYSFPLESGAFWFFGDTIIGRRIPGQSLWLVDNEVAGPADLSGRGSIASMPNNTALILRTSDASDGLREYQYLLDARGQIRQVIEHLPEEDRNEYRIWCLHGCRIEETVHVFYQKIHMVKEGPFPVNFEVVGAGLATGKSTDWAFRRLEANGDTVWWGRNLPQFGSAVLLQRDEGRAYVYGVRKDAAGVQHASLARVRLTSLRDLRAYEYLSGAGPQWSSDPSRSVSLFTGPPNELSVSFNPHLRSFLAVHSLDLTGKVVGRTAPDPWGPWSEPAVLSAVTPTREPLRGYPNMIYAAKEHPELARDGGRVLYITYIEFEEYYPHLLEITLV